MIKIAKGDKVNYVSKSAFNNFFEPFGWEIVGEDYTPPKPVIEEEAEKEIVDPVAVNNSDDADDSDEWDEVLDELQDDEVEKPLSEMNRAELIKKAESMGIDISKLNTNKQLREAIKSCM